LVPHRVDALPVVNEVLRRLRLVEIVDRYLPARDARVKIDPAVVVAVLVCNALLGHRPGYAVGQWAASYDAALFGLDGGQRALLTDDRLGRVLDQLFDADRASLLTELVLLAVEEFDVDTGECHNDSTSITFRGGRPDRGGGRRGGRACQMVCVTVLSGLVSLWVRGYGLGRTRQVLRGLVSSRW
jgi:hypothetical protein